MATATKQRSAAEQSRAEVARLHQAELDLSQRRHDVAATLGALEAGFGDALLSGYLAAADPDPGVLDGSRSARSEIATLDSAIHQARVRRRAAISLVWKAEAAALRARAALLRGEAEQRQQRTAGLLAQLADFEGCAYVPHRLAAGPLPVGDVAGGAPTVLLVPTPRTELLRMEAAGLEAQAGEPERREIRDRGAISGDGAGSLLAQLRGWDPMTMALPLATATAWAVAAERAVRARQARIAPLANQTGHGAPIRLELIWVGDDIDERRSRASIPALDD